MVRSCDTTVIFVQSKPERTEFTNSWINTTQWRCVKVAFVDKALPGKSGTFKECRDSVTCLGFQKTFENLSQRLFKK